MTLLVLTDVLPILSIGVPDELSIEVTFPVTVV
jgi:hypothetical protein